MMKFERHLHIFKAFLVIFYRTLQLSLGIQEA